MTTNPSYVPGPQPIGLQQVVTTQPAPVAVGTVGSQPRGSTWKTLMCTGIAQVVLGSLTILLGIVTLAVFRDVLYGSDVGSPIWCGLVFYVVAGILGILAGRLKKSGLAVGYMVLSILACLAAVCVVAFSGARMDLANTVCRSYYYLYGCELKAAVNGVYALLIVLAVAEFVVAIVAASHTCSPLCSTGQPTQTVIQYQAQPHVLVATQQPHVPVPYSVTAGQPQFAYPAQLGQYPQAQAPPSAYPPK